ncbi:MAG: NlpC/P60 family protein [Pseudomonadota bacterium]
MSAATEQNVTPADIIDAARSWLSTPYVHQASAKGAGCDCLGLVRGVWRDLYGREPERPPAYTPDWNERHWREGAGEPLLAAARRNLVAKDGKGIEAGAVIIFRVAADGPAKHCGIATSPNAFIHAYAGRAVVESWMNRWWRARIAGVFRFPGAL